MPPFPEDLFSGCQFWSDLCLRAGEDLDACKKMVRLGVV